MTIRVRLFALARDAAQGADRLDLTLPDGATVADAMSTLAGRYSAIAPLASRLAVAVNLEYVPRSYVLNEGDELALIPPVSGG